METLDIFELMGRWRPFKIALPEPLTALMVILITDGKFPADSWDRKQDGSLLGFSI